MKALFIFLAIASIQSLAQAKLESTYTSVQTDDCATYDASDLHPNAEIDFYTGECPGLGGYQVMISGGDLRYPLHLVYGGKKITLTQFLTFHQLGSNKIEWLYERSSQGKVTYKALIHRMGYDSYNPETNMAESTEALIVSKLDGANTCSVAVVKKSANMNQKAREIAEKAQSMKCLDLNEEL